MAGKTCPSDTAELASRTRNPQTWHASDSEQQHVLLPLPPRGRSRTHSPRLDSSYALESGSLKQQIKTP